MQLPQMNFLNHVLTLTLLAILSFGNVEAQVLAFPGAEGAGKYTIGGRGGTVYEVTNLDDDGPGSFRAAVETSGPRTVVFRVSGTIELQSEIEINDPYLTIAGQTAPGDGICIRGYQVQNQTIQVIIRYLRFRLGDETGVDTDCIWGRNRWDIIIDHCSASWSVDETMSFYGNQRFTLQYCLVAESLYDSNHPEGHHGFGGIWGGTNASFHHNLFAHHSSRNPRFAGSQTNTCVNTDFRNNVIYNWGYNSSYGGEGGSINMVANYYKSGPATTSSKLNRIVEPSDANGSWYIEDNYVEGYPLITANNWAGGVQGSYASPALIRSDTAHTFVAIPVETAEEAYAHVLTDVGANYPHRDAVDLRILNDVVTGTATYDGHAYEIAQGFSDTSVVRGIIDSQNDVGGWPVLNSLPAPDDDDHDGMPNWWENSHGLNPDDDSDRNLLDPDGFTMLEVYLNELITLPAGFSDETPVTHSSLIQNYPNPFNSETRLRFSLEQATEVSVRIMDVRGRQIKSLRHDCLTPGEHEVSWDASNDHGQQVASGIYFGILHFNDSQQIIKMQLLR